MSNSMAQFTPLGLPVEPPPYMKLINIMEVIVGISVSVFFLTRRLYAVRSWRRTSYNGLLPLLIYVVLFIYTVASSVLLFSDIDIYLSRSACLASYLVCLLGYFGGKGLVHLFLVNRAHIVRSTPCPRLKSKLYIFNSFGMIGVYIIFAVLLFVFRIESVNDGIYRITLRSSFFIPLAVAEVVINIYLTLLFLIPLLRLHSFKVQWRRPACSLGGSPLVLSAPCTESSLRLSHLAWRTFLGACILLVTTTSNLTAGVIIGAEPSWVCHLTCRCDVIVNAIVIYWLTSRRETATEPPRHRAAQFSANAAPIAEVVVYRPNQDTPY